MGYYKVSSTASKRFILTQDEKTIGMLKYATWYSFKAEIVLSDDEIYNLEPAGFWDSRMEIRKNGKTMLDFEMGWRGIAFRNYNAGQEEKYLLKLKGFLNSKYVLVDINEKELLVVNADLKWTKLDYDFVIETSSDFDKLENKELLLLTAVHSINYSIALTNASM